MLYSKINKAIYIHALNKTEYEHKVAEYETENLLSFKLDSILFYFNPHVLPHTSSHWRPSAHFLPQIFYLFHSTHRDGYYTRT